MPHLDQYEADGLGEAPDDYDAEAELEARLRAEAALDDRDQAEGRTGERGAGRVRPRALDADDDDDQWRRQQRRRRAADRGADGDDEDEEAGTRGWDGREGFFIYLFILIITHHRRGREHGIENGRGERKTEEKREIKINVHA